jgi:hypothetical protein
MSRVNWANAKDGGDFLKVHPVRAETQDLARVKADIRRKVVGQMCRGNGSNHASRSTGMVLTMRPVSSMMPTPEGMLPLGVGD